MRRVTPLIVAGAVALAGLALSACGSGGPSYAASKDCRVSVSNTDYAGCDLAGRDLTNVDFQADDLRRANLSGADLDGANLQGAALEGADTKAAITDGETVCVNGVLGPCTELALHGPGHARGGS